MTALPYSLPSVDAEKSHDLACEVFERVLLRQAEGRYDEAWDERQCTLALMTSAVGTAHPDLANVLNTMSALAVTLDRYDDAERFSNQAVAIMSDLAIDDEAIHRIRIQAHGALATVYRLQGRYAEAERLFQSAIAMAEDALGPHDPDLSSGLNNLGILYK